jgi:DNA-binding IscR family transcriptional regulator
VLTAEDDTVAPGRDLAAMTVAEVLDAIRHESPDPRRPVPHGVPAADAAARAADSAMRERMSTVTLRDLITGSDGNTLPTAVDAIAQAKSLGDANDPGASRATEPRARKA